MRFNLEKCTFFVRDGKFLGFYLTERGIEDNPNKCEVVIQMKAPTSNKNIQKLNGMLIALNMFISRFIQWELPFYKLLRKQTEFEWNAEFNDVFESLKSIIATQLVLTRPS